MLSATLGQIWYSLMYQCGTHIVAVCFIQGIWARASTPGVADNESSPLQYTQQKRHSDYMVQTRSVTQQHKRSQEACNGLRPYVFSSAHVKEVSGQGIKGVKKQNWGHNTPKQPSKQANKQTSKYAQHLTTWLKPKSPA